MFDRLFEILQSMWDALLPWVVLQPWEAGILVRLGRVKKVIGPGFHWIIPFRVDAMWHESVTPTTHHINGLSTTTKDGRSIGFDAIITYQITDIEKALTKVTSVNDAIVDTCKGVIGTALSESTWDDVLHGRSTEELTKLCRARGWKWGIEVMAVQLAGVCAVKNIRLSGSASGGELTVTHGV
jgi:regulator of protease activity HflC (stomatin/prohibitin superfamily)